MGHRGAAAGHQEIVYALGHQHAIRQFVEAARVRDRRKLEDDVTRDMLLHRPAIDADGIVKRGAAKHVVARQHVATDHAPRLADAELRRQVDDVGFFKARYGAQEFERLQRLPPSVDLAVLAVVRDIKARAKPVSASGEIAQVGTIAANGDGEIGAPRLKAEPTARRCIACQEQLEQRPDAPPRPTM